MYSARGSAPALFSIGSMSSTRLSLSMVASLQSPLLFHLVELIERSEEHTSELQSLAYLVCRILLAKKNTSELQSLAYLVCRLLLEKKKTSEPRTSARSHAAMAISKTTKREQPVRRE